jgi:hypothetical protein
MNVGERGRSEFANTSPLSARVVAFSVTSFCRWMLLLLFGMGENADAFAIRNDNRLHVYVNSFIFE